MGGYLIGKFEGALSMRRVLLFLLSGLAGTLFLATAAQAKGPDPADFPLRVHILKNSSRSRHARESKSFGEGDYLDGEGGADLFENGQPTGFEFTYSCIDPLRASAAYATYPARWKKRGKTLEILIPQPGKPWNMETCELQTTMRPGLAYAWNDQDDAVVEQSAAVFKAWMVAHRYDPEKDMDDPLEDPPAAAGTPGTDSSSASGPGPK
jgi:hypothetical protein